MSSKYPAGGWHTPVVIEEATWHIAYRACPCGCGYDADFLIDNESGDMITYRCYVPPREGGH
jgi:hypothetical protein